MLEKIKNFLCPENDSDMITPKLIKIGYMIEVVVACIAVIPAFLYFAFAGKIIAMLCVPVAFVSTILGAKIACEVLLLAFRMNDNLKAIREKLEDK